MPVIPYSVRCRLETLWTWVLWLMADIPVGGGPHPKFSPQVTLGNILTILGGLLVAVGMYGAFVSRMDGLETTVRQLQCDLARAGVIATTVPCTFVNGSR